MENLTAGGVEKTMLGEEDKRPVWESWTLELISNMVRARPGICIFESHMSCLYDETETYLEDFDFDGLTSTLESCTEQFVFVVVRTGPRCAPLFKHMSLLVIDTVEQCAWYVDPLDRIMEPVRGLMEHHLERLVRSYEWKGATALNANLDGDCVPATATFAYAVRDLGGVPAAVDMFASLGDTLREVYDEFYKAWKQ